MFVFFPLQNLIRRDRMPAQIYCPANTWPSHHPDAKVVVLSITGWPAVSNAVVAAALAANTAFILAFFLLQLPSSSCHCETWHSLFCSRLRHLSHYSSQSISPPAAMITATGQLLRSQVPLATESPEISTASITASTQEWCGHCILYPTLE